MKLKHVVSIIKDIVPEHIFLFLGRDRGSLGAITGYLTVNLEIMNSFRWIVEV